MKTVPLSRGQKYGLMYGAAGNFMSHLSHADRVRVKRAAAKQGVTVSGLLQGGPAALRERSQAGIKKQALSTINAAYAPAEADIGSRRAQTNALDEKRRTDDQYYSDWLTSQQKTADAVSAASDAALLTQAAQLHGQAQAAGDANQQAAVQQAASTPGNVSNPDQSTALQAGLSANTTKSVGAADIANANAVAQVARSGAQRATLQASNYAQAAALEARRQGDTYKALAGLSDEDAKLKLNKAADTSKEIARLLDQEVAKAENNQQTSILANKLNVQQSQFAQTLAVKKGALKVSQQNANTSRAAQRANARIKQINVQLQSQSLSERERHNLVLERQAQQRIAKSGKGALGPSAGERTASRKQITAINNAVSTIKMLEGQKSGGKPLTSTQIRQFLNSPKGAKNPYGGFDRLITNAAYDIRVFGHLSPANFTALKQAGVLIPRSWRPPGPSGAQREPRT